MVAWGRSIKNELLTSLFHVLLLVALPPLVMYFWMACDTYGCSMAAPVDAWAKYRFTWAGFKVVFVRHLPQPTWQGFQLYGGWLLFQGLLATYLPCKIGLGQRTPAGHILPYKVIGLRTWLVGDPSVLTNKVNGLRAWLLTHALFVGGAWLGWFKATIIHDNWGALLVAANVYGYLLTAFVYVKALYFPTHPDDCKWSGSFLYDMFMGAEFNPRFGKYFDFKLFHNARIGILAWTLINLSFAAAQYERIGYVTNSMVLVNLLQACYVIDLFINEDWYLRTVDIAHDHFGFYLAWGDAVWMPFTYTLQSHYLLKHPVDLPAWAALTVAGMGMFGYYIFRATNHQKDIVRRTDGGCLIWGRPAKYIRARYLTADGKHHQSILLASGWWGLAGHVNYTGDLVLSAAMCAACGFTHLLPWFYAIYMFIFLAIRIRRDNARCSGKYGAAWKEYKELVPYNLIPYVF